MEIKNIIKKAEVKYQSIPIQAKLALWLTFCTLVQKGISVLTVPIFTRMMDTVEYGRVSAYFSWLNIASIMIVFITLAPEAIYILAGAKYASAAYVIPPVAGSVVFLFLYTNFANIEFYYDYNKFTMYISMIGAALNIVLNYVFIKMFGYVAAGYTTFVCYLVYCIGHYIFVEHIIKKKFGRHLIDWKYLAILFVLLVVLMILMSLTYK